jgi:hypothetical protein
VVTLWRFEEWTNGTRRGEGEALRNSGAELRDIINAYDFAPRELGMGAGAAA